MPWIYPCFEVSGNTVLKPTSTITIQFSYCVIIQNQKHRNHKMALRFCPLLLINHHKTDF